LVNGTVTAGALHVTAGAPVSAYGLNTEQYSTDGYLGLPTPILGTSYIAEGYESNGGFGGSDLAVVGTKNGTTVTITPTATTEGYTAGVPFTETLNQGDVFQLIDADGDASGGDLSGTTITSSQPVAVFAGNDCAYVPPTDQACNTLAEEMTPVNTWGTDFLTEPLATRSGDTFRVMASKNGTTVDIGGSTVATLNAGQFYETILSSASTITTNNPVQLMQYSNGSSYDEANSDPFEITIPPTEQFLNSYTVATEPDGADPAITQNYLNIVAPTSEVSSISLDGSALPSSDFSPIAGSSYSGAQVAVGFGSHTVSAALPFGLTVYGEGGYDGYGYPGGFTLSPIATVAGVSLAPTTSHDTVGASQCETATVTDSNGNPVSGVRVNFTVTGSNPNTGFAYSATNGTAQYCYTGTAAGTDTETAAVGNITSNKATITWTMTAPPPATSITTTLSGDNQTGAKITIPAGQPAGDSAVLSGTNAATATGTVTYQAYSDKTCTTLVATSAGTVTKGKVAASAAKTLAAGTYYWTASYSGDAHNAASASSCGSEVLTIKAQAVAPNAIQSIDTEATAWNKSTATAHVTTRFQGDLIVAFVAANGPSTAKQTVTVSGGGLTWYRISRQNPTGSDTEVWVALPSSTLHATAVTATSAIKGYDVVLAVEAFHNASGVGPESFTTATTGAPKATLKTAASNTWVFAIGVDWSKYAPPTAASGQLVISQLNAPGGKTAWLQATNAPTPRAGTTVTISDTHPTTDPYDLMLVGIQ
jgi:hypothetical protein